MAKQYTQSDIHYLIENYGKIPVEDIAKTLGRNKFAIYRLAHQWHLSKPNYIPDKITVKQSLLIYPYKKVTQCTVPDQTTMSTYPSKKDSTIRKISNLATS